MSKRDKTKVTGHLKISMNGKVVREVKNLVVNTGLALIASRIQGTSDAVMSDMAIGKGVADPDETDVALGDELSRLTLTTLGGTANGPVITYEATWGPGIGTGSITEAGLFNATTMLARTSFPIVNKGVADTMTNSWNITIA